MLGKLFDRQTGAGSAPGSNGPRVPRHSGGWGTLRVYMADLIEDAFTGDWQKGEDEDGKPIWDTEGFSKQNLHFSGRTFDMVLLWTTLDYLPEALVVPVVQALHRSMEPGGQLIAVFHTKLQPEISPYHRFHITQTDDVELQLAQSAKQQRALTNRNIERLFADWSGLKQFLAKDGVSEAIIVR